ncbi:MAG: hypothetical protein IIX76_06365 [Bacteroidales bacterium]|nr:hypothetical protein [Bacteroidales bacterium]
MGAENKHKNILENSTLKANPFIVPNGYIAEVERSVMETITPTGQQPGKNRFGIIEILKPAIGLAACFALIFGIGYGALYLTGNTESKNSTSTVQIAEENIPESTETESDTIYINEDAAEEYLINSGVSSSTLASLE